MGWWEQRVVPHMVKIACGMKALRPLRSDVMDGLNGTILEVGFGSGANVGLYPDDVDRVLAVEPSMRGRELGAKAVVTSDVPIEFVGLDGAALTLDDESVSGALSTFTLCTIPDIDRALTEIHRVLEPGATFHFLEHGRSPDPDLARRQDRYTPLQKRMAGGCHLNRPIGDMVESAGFRIDRLDTFLGKGPKVASWYYLGVATRSDPPQG
jgi:ubiquinone/menaquinone biosynthesis C-methylase UbiE